MRLIIVCIVGLSLIGAEPLHAESIADVFRVYGFEGTWSDDCSVDFGTRLTVTKGADGRVSVVAVGERGTSSITIRNATAVTDEKFAFEYEEVKEGRREVGKQVLTKIGNELETEGVLLDRCKDGFR